MGQYYYVCNIDKKEFLHPHHMGDGLKLLEFACSADATMTGLGILLACSNGRGGGDLHPGESERDRQIYEHMVGRWAGDRIAIIGDYHEPGDIPGVTDLKIADTGGYSGYENGEPQHEAAIYGDVPWNDSRHNSDSPLDLGWVNISNLVLEAMGQDAYLKSQLRPSWSHGKTSGAKLNVEGTVAHTTIKAAEPA